MSIPNFIGNGRTKVSDIINNLRQIDGAKNEWAFERGFTNESQILQLTNQFVEKDLFPYLHHNPDKPNDLVPSVNGDIYIINPLNRGPEAKLTHKEKFGNQILPKGTSIRLKTDPANGFPYQIIFPDGTKMHFKIERDLTPPRRGLFSAHEKDFILAFNFRFHGFAGARTGRGNAATD